MKVPISLFDRLRLEFALEQGEDGAWSITKLFPKFPDRPANPHLSIFFTPERGYLTPHFAAANGTPRRFRRDLIRVRPAHFAKAIADFKAKAIRRLAEVLKPVDLPALEAEGWRVYWADLRVLKRWMRFVRKNSREFKVNAATVYALILHVLRHHAWPTQLEGVPQDKWLKMLALRWDIERKSAELRVLMFSPDGIPTIDDLGNLGAQTRAGWYSYPIEMGMENVVSQFVPQEKAQEVVSDVEKCLERYPRRKPPVEVTTLDSLPSFVWNILGFYAPDLLQLAFASVEAGGKSS